MLEGKGTNLFLPLCNTSKKDRRGGRGENCSSSFTPNSPKQKKQRKKSLPTNTHGENWRHGSHPSRNWNPTAKSFFPTLKAEALCNWYLPTSWSNEKSLSYRFLLSQNCWKSYQQLFSPFWLDGSIPPIPRLFLFSPFYYCLMPDQSIPGQQSLIRGGKVLTGLTLFLPFYVRKM